MLPVHGQRARPNGRTTRRKLSSTYTRVLRVMRFKRASPCSIFGATERKKKIQNKLNATRAKKGLKLKQKGPVKRSKDSKKSV